MLLLQHSYPCLNEVHLVLILEEILEVNERKLRNNVIRVSYQVLRLDSEGRNMRRRAYFQHSSLLLLDYKQAQEGRTVMPLSE